MLIKHLVPSGSARDETSYTNVLSTQPRNGPFKAHYMLKQKDLDSFFLLCHHYEYLTKRNKKIINEEEC